MIPLSIPSIGEEEVEAVKEVLLSGWLAHGFRCKEFEESFAEYIGVKRAVTTSSCTASLQLVIESKKLNGEILVPSFTFVASANSIILSKCKPVFVEIDYDTCNIDPKKIEEKITNKTKAIMPVHFGGQCCRMGEIMEIAEKYDLEVIEDSAECIGGSFNNKMGGSFGVGCFSFFPTKNITTGEGGMVTTDDEELADDISVLKSHGISNRKKKEKGWMRESVVAGYNFRMCDILAAIGLVQLKKVERLNELRRKHASYLNKNLVDVEGISLPKEKKGFKHVYQMYTIKLEGYDRNEFVLNLRSLGVGASVHFCPPLHLQTYYKGLGCGCSLSVTERVADSIVTLPMYPELTKEDLDIIVNAIGEVVKLSKK